MTAPDWLGIDLGGTFIKWELLGDDGASLGSGRTATPTTGHIAVTEAIIRIVNDYSAGESGLAGVGIAVPGHLSEERDSITLLPNVAGEWLGFSVRSYIAEHTGYEPTLLNDARAFARAELELGAAVGASDAVFATIGTGIGGAVAVNGQVVSSRRDSFGEIGHSTAVAGGETCACGGRGCVEAYAGGTSVLARAKRRGVTVDAGPDALISLAFAALSDPIAASVLEEAYDAFAVGVSSLCAVTGSHLVVVGGAVATELPGYLDRTRERLVERFGLLGTVEVRVGLLGSRAGALGAALARRDHSHSSMTPSNTTPARTELEHQA
ncbi:ROK family protein [Lacisediminihabitans sp. FW035]